jgi:hypothetical protein
MQSQQTPIRTLRSQNLTHPNISVIIFFPVRNIVQPTGMCFRITLEFPGNLLYVFSNTFLPETTARIVLFAKQQNIRLLLLICAAVIHPVAAPYSFLASGWKDEYCICDLVLSRA